MAKKYQDLQELDLPSLVQELRETKQEALLKHAGDLMKLLGDIRSELFHYEVRATYDTPEIAESRISCMLAPATEDVHCPTASRPPPRA